MHEKYRKSISATAYDTYSKLMRKALAEAAHPFHHDDIPVGALVVRHDGTIVSKGYNQNERYHDPTLHAEIVALRKASRLLDTSRLDGYTLVTTLEPCPMCAGAIINARIGRLIFAAWDPKAGAAGSVLDIMRNRLLPYQVEVIGEILEEESAALLKRFFGAKRRNNTEDIC